MPKKEIAIRINDVHKNFILPQHKNTSFKQAAVNIVKKNNKVTQKVLDGVSVDIYKGEFFGIVGRNGSGKSTLLKLIAGVYAPTSGNIEVHGGLTPFIELGVGFNPELSGRDNVYLNGALLGFTRKQMDAMYQEIVDFAELEQHMDQKLKNYSSGMQVRLAFSIAVKAKNDILIFDEVLAVGDESFQRKCMTVFEDYRRNNQTVILVTHSMENVNALCTRALMLSDGKVEIIGNVREVADAYTKSNSPDEKIIEHQEDYTKIAKDVEVTGNKPSYHKDEIMKLTLRWSKAYDIHKVGVAIVGPTDEYVFGSNSGGQAVSPGGMKYSVKLNLGPGKYKLNIAVYDSSGELRAIEENIAKFQIYNDFDNTVGGLTVLEHKYTNL